MAEVCLVCKKLWVPSAAPHASGVVAQANKLPALVGWRQEDPKLKIILVTNWMPVWDIRHLV